MLDLIWLDWAQRLLNSSLHAAGKVVAALTDSLEYPLARVLIDLHHTSDYDGLPSAMAVSYVR